MSGLNFDYRQQEILLYSVTHADKSLLARELGISVAETGRTLALLAEGIGSGKYGEMGAFQIMLLTKALTHSTFFAQRTDWPTNVGRLYVRSANVIERKIEAVTGERPKIPRNS